MLYGDAEDLELLRSLPLDRADWVISTIPTIAINLALVQELHQLGFEGRVALTAHTRHAAEVVGAVDGVVVLQPFTAAASQGVHLVHDAAADDTADSGDAPSPAGDHP